MNHYSLKMGQRMGIEFGTFHINQLFIKIFNQKKNAKNLEQIQPALLDCVFRQNPVNGHNSTQHKFPCWGIQGRPHWALLSLKTSQELDPHKEEYLLNPHRYRCGTELHSRCSSGWCTNETGQNQGESVPVHMSGRKIKIRRRRRARMAGEKGRWEVRAPAMTETGTGRSRDHVGCLGGWDSELLNLPVSISMTSGLLHSTQHIQALQRGRNMCLFST